MKKEKRNQASEMTQPAKMLATKPDDQRWILGAHIIGENRFPPENTISKKWLKIKVQ